MFTIIHKIIVTMLKPLWRIKGGFHLAKIVRNTYLSLGGNPIILARVNNKANMWLDLRSHTEWYSYYSGRYDFLTVKICLSGLEDGEQFLDVGANIGMYAIFIGLQRPSSNSVIAFEPHVSNFERVAKNIKANKLESTVVTHNIGLSDKTNTAELVLREDFIAGSGTGNASIAISDEADHGFTKTSIKLRALDDLAEELELFSIGVIKVDIEGHEPEFLKGARNVLREQRPIIVSEINRQLYRWRNIDEDTVLPALLPKDYQILRETKTQNLEVIDSLSSVGEIENIIFCPQEKITRYAAYM